MSIPSEFKEFADLLRAANTIGATNPSVAAVLQNCFKETIQDMASSVSLSPQASQFVQTFSASCPPMPPNGIGQVQEYANNYFNQLSAEISQGNFRLGQIKDFQICHTLFRILDGDDNLVKSKKCMQVAIKIKKMFDKGMKDKSDAGKAGAPPSFTPSAPSSHGPPSFDPYGSTAGGPPVFTPPGSTAGGPPAFTPSSGPTAGGPPVFTPPGSTNGPPAFDPYGSTAGGPPAFTPSSGGTSGGPPVFTPPGSTNGPPAFDPYGSTAGGPPAFTPSSGTSGGPPSFTPGAPQAQAPEQFSIPVDPTFDVKGATRLIQSMGYKMEDSSQFPPLNQRTFSSIDGYLEYAVRGIHDSDKATCLSFLQEALSIWQSGKIL